MKKKRSTLCSWFLDAASLIWRGWQFTRASSCVITRWMVTQCGDRAGRPAWSPPFSSYKASNDIVGVCPHYSLIWSYSSPKGPPLNTINIYVCTLNFQHVNVEENTLNPNNIPALFPLLHWMVCQPLRSFLIPLLSPFYNPVLSAPPNCRFLQEPQSSRKFSRCVVNKYNWMKKKIVPFLYHCFYNHSLCTEQGRLQWAQIQLFRPS